MTHDTEVTGLLTEHDGSERRISLDGQQDVLESKQRVQDEAELVRLLDRRLLPMIVAIFVMNYVDRTAIAAARLRGLEEDLHLTHFQYETAIAVLYLSYCPMQIPSNLLLNKAPSPRLFIGGCVVAWGVLSAVTGATRDFKDVLICRFLVGIPEAAFFPGAIYLLSRWYTRKELAFRSAILYTGLLISNAFSSLLAAGVLSTLEGIDGIRAWRWLFFIEGAITVVVGLASMIVLPDYPGNTSWLSASQQRIAQTRLAEEAGSADQDGADDTIWTGLIAAVKDVRTILLAWGAFFGIWGLGFSNFFPSIAATMGFDMTTTLLLAAPPWIIASVLCLINARHADTTGERFFHICSWYWVTIVGYLLAMSSMNTVTRYISLFLLAAGYAGFSLVMVWVSNSIPRPPGKRAAAIALVNGFGNLGNIAGSYTWKEQYFGPAYRESCVIGIVALSLSTVMALLLRRKLLQLNSELEEQERLASETIQEAEDEAVLLAGRLQGVSIAEAVAKKRSFRYLY